MGSGGSRRDLREEEEGKGTGNMVASWSPWRNPKVKVLH